MSTLMPVPIHSSVVSGEVKELKQDELTIEGILEPAGLARITLDSGPGVVGIRSEHGLLESGAKVVDLGILVVDEKSES